MIDLVRGGLSRFTLGPVVNSGPCGRRAELRWRSEAIGTA